ncbi:VPDSG-CTERM sorting domain-containing protein [Pelagicoccus sp. SDUM812005]|uniref:VPDSG-CTERM sorting domain-containing protein n=1 Tax=Pelagicoccus sp. SDUM812005 TaxID=3041257 RepID=UPI00280FFB2A|nr:VPDSG-CTERM sorting domain-containing protein [Pelagicoccus sp. SDUM812005]MDQ8181537.1 VPDSG-CTERM sorting domain-containing protein [Pelagicoccus sp. SDUM812005]
MKKLLSLAALASLFVVSQASAIIVPVSESATSVEFDFNLKDHAFNTTGVTETYTFTSFVGNSVSLTFDDRIAGYLQYVLFGPWIPVGNIEILTTDPTSTGLFQFNQNTGSLNFKGKYSEGGQTVTWSVESTVYTDIGFDHWAGTFKAQVPDSGSSFALLGLGVLGLVGLRRRFAK